MRPDPSQIHRRPPGPLPGLIRRSKKGPLTRSLQRIEKRPLPLPMGEVDERSEVGEGIPIFCEKREKSNICSANIR